MTAKQENNKSCNGIFHSAYDILYKPLAQKKTFSKSCGLLTEAQKLNSAVLSIIYAGWRK